MRHRAKAPIHASESASVAQTEPISAGVTVLPRHPMPAWARHAAPEPDGQPVDAVAEPPLAPVSDPIPATAEQASPREPVSQPALAQALSEFAAMPDFAAYSAPVSEPQLPSAVSASWDAAPAPAELPSPRYEMAAAGRSESATMLADASSGFGGGFPAEAALDSARRRHAEDHEQVGAVGWSGPAVPPALASAQTNDELPALEDFLFAGTASALAGEALSNFQEPIDPDPQSGTNEAGLFQSAEAEASTAQAAEAQALESTDAPVNGADELAPTEDAEEAAATDEQVAPAPAKSKGALVARLGISFVAASVVGAGAYVALDRLVFTDEVDATAAALPTTLSLPGRFGDLGATTSAQADLRLRSLLGMPRRAAGLTTAGGYAFAPGTPTRVAAKVSSVPGAFGADELVKYAKRTGAKLGKPLAGSSGTTTWTCAAASATKVTRAGAVCTFASGVVTGQSFVLSATPEKAGAVTANLVAQLH